MKDRMAITPAIVTNAELRFGFNVVQSLTRHGVSCVALGRTPRTMAKGLDNVLWEAAYPNPFSDPAGYIEAINYQARQLAGDSVAFFPTHEDIFIATKYAHLLDENIVILADTHDSLMAFHDKWNLSKLTQASGLPSPRTVLLSKTSFEDWPDDLIVKPRFGEGGHGVRRVKKSALLMLDPSQPNHDELLVQECVPGRGVGISILARQGNILAISGHLRLRELPRTGGTSCSRQTFHHDTMFAKVEHMITASGFSGVMMLEFRFDEATGNYWLIDANPRYFGGMSTHIESGVNYPVLQYEAFIQGNMPDKKVTATKTVESRWLLGEIGYLLASFKAFDLKGIKQTVTKRKGIRVVYEDFSLASLRRFMTQLRNYVVRWSDKKSGSQGDLDRKRFFRG